MRGRRKKIYKLEIRKNLAVEYYFLTILRLLVAYIVTIWLEFKEFLVNVSFSLYVMHMNSMNVLTSELFMTSIPESLTNLFLM